MSNTQYKTFQIRIKKGHRLFPYFQQMCHDAKNMYNTTNFYIRQVFTALRQENALQPLQSEVLATLNHYIVKMNETASSLSGESL
jgi:putative transposase